MIKSTASAGPVELQSSPSAYYLWEFPEKPVSVRVSLDVVDRLERDVLESFRAITARGSEVGGLLLGRSEPGPTMKTIIENYELFHCDYSRGPLYLLSDEEKARLEEAIRRKKGMPGQAGSVVGFFRSNTRKNLALDEEDLDVFREYFSRPEQAFLLVKPFAAKASLAGIFIWEDKKVRSEGSYIEFPFRRSELGKGDFAKSIVADAPRQQELEPEPTAPAPPAGPAAHKTGSRAPVLPFSLKRDEEPPVPAPPLKKEERAPVAPLIQQTETVVPDVAEPVAAPKPVPAIKLTETKPKAEKPAPALPPLREENPESKPEPKPEAKQEEKKVKPKDEKKVEKKVEKKAEKETAQKESPAPVKPEPKVPAVTAAPVEKPEPVMRFESLHERSPFSGQKLWALFGGLAMLAAAGGTLYYLKTQPAAKATDAATQVAPRVAPGFELKAERSHGQLLVSWNRESDLIRTAKSAVLSISDGAKTEDVPLDLTQLRAGSIIYSPLSPDVSFKLEVRNGREGRTRSESVRAPADGVPTSSNPKDAVKPAPSPAAATPQAQAAPAAQPTQAPAEASRVDTNAVTEAALARPTPEPPKPFSLAARIRQPEPTDLPEAPSVDPSATASTLRPSVPGHLPAPQIPSPPPPQPTLASVQPAPAAGSLNARVGGKAQEPKLLRRVDAVFPPMARQARVGGVVRLQASVGKDGKVKKIEVLSGPPLLRQAAIDAVQKWVYSPALLNGSPIDTVTDVDVNFNLSGR